MNKTFAQYPVSVINLQWFYGDKLNLRKIKDMLEPSTLEKCADLSVYDIFISALTLEYSNLNQQDSSKHENHDDEYGEFLSGAMVDEFDTDSIKMT